MAKSESAVVGVVILGMVGFAIAIGTTWDSDRRIGITDPTPMRTATQAPRDTYPDCRDAPAPCVSRVDGAAWLVTESGAQIPAIVTGTDETSSPRMITIA